MAEEFDWAWAAHTALDQRDAALAENERLTALLAKVFAAETWDEIKALRAGGDGG